MDRRTFLASTGAFAGGFGLALASRPALAQQGSIKIGLLAPLTGVVAAGGRAGLSRIRFGLELQQSHRGALYSARPERRARIDGSGRG